MKQVYTLEDLGSRELLDVDCAKPARLAVIGHPVAHSASPQMHQPALDAAGINARYIRLDIETGQVADAFARMRALGFIGCNVTVPHKLEAMAACDEVHPEATLLGAVNTIRFDAEMTRGFNTDGPGFASAIQDDFNKQLGSLKVGIVGAGGGAGGAIAMQSVIAGVNQLLLVNRTLEKLSPLMERLMTVNPELKVTAMTFEDPALTENSLSCDLIVNTSSVGLKAGDPSILPQECLKCTQLVYDTIYQPVVTPLLDMANQNGCRTANGLSMLIHQGALAFQHWFPQSTPLAVMQAAMSHFSRA
jgi:shikimate dehydrogenase